MGLVNETVHAFNSEYNLGNDKAKSLMPYARPVVEKYVFGKLYDRLFAMYAVKNEVEDRLFVERSRSIKRMRAEDVMVYLGINRKFIINQTVMGGAADSLRPSYGQQDTSTHALSEQTMPNPFGMKDKIGDYSSQF